MKKGLSIISLILVLLLSFTACGGPVDNGGDVSTPDTTTTENIENITADQSVADTSTTVTEKETEKQTEKQTETTTKKPTSSSDSRYIPAYSGKSYVAINNNQPTFTSADYTTKAFEKYSPLDSLGRCGVTYACIGKEIMPTEDRGSIGQVKPTGWHTVKYDCVDGKYLYNRCHLIGYQLTGENANTRNLITGTRYMNVDGMLPFENMVADYIKETGNHVLYRVTPIFEGKNLVASGVQIEAWSVEDNGDGICFNVYCYNVQPGVVIDYATGESRLANSTETTTKKTEATTKKTETTTKKQETTTSNSNIVANSSQYVLNTNSKKIHVPSCGSAKRISDKNRAVINGNQVGSYLNSGYTYCGNCLA